jgi:predicted secreted hydrolase
MKRTKKRKYWLWWLLLLLGLSVAVRFVQDDRHRQVRATLTVPEILANADTIGYSRADKPREFSFPEDHGPHPDFKTEWWYFTGHLDASDGQEFGFQLTFFRSALSPEQMNRRTSAWRSGQVYMAHFALSDLTEQQFYAFERFSRDGMGLAGARSYPLLVWLEDWFVKSYDEASSNAVPVMELAAQQDGIALQLRAESVKPPVLQGQDGLSQKSAAPGNASYYYSLTRMSANGTVTTGDKIFEVTGAAWMDREWSTSALGQDQVGWDWFSLQLSNNSELMYYQLRNKLGQPDQFSQGMLVDAKGKTRHFNRDEIRISVLKYWQSPRGGRYPARWRLRIDAMSTDLTISAKMADQELDVTFRYWEGAVAVDGLYQAQQVSGQGYVELTGYAPE